LHNPCQSLGFPHTAHPYHWYQAADCIATSIAQLFRLHWLAELTVLKEMIPPEDIVPGDYPHRKSPPPRSVATLKRKFENWY